MVRNAWAVCGQSPADQVRHWDGGFLLEEPNDLDFVPDLLVTK